MKKILFNVSVVLIIAMNAIAQEATFESLGILPGGQNSMAHSVSADGTIVVGQSEVSLGPTGGTEAFRWNETEEIVGLGDLPGGIFTSFARGVSSDGNIIVGTGWGDGFTEALRWENDVMEGIGFLPGGSDSFAYAISDDGLTIVGYGFNAMWSSEAFRWTQENGIEGLGFLSGEAESTGFDVSGDGTVIVGYAMRSDGFYEAFRWTEAGGMEGLGDLPGGYFESTAWGVSADGSTIVGYSSTGSVDYEAFRWTEAGGMESIGDLPGGGTFGMARATSADGSVIVGEGLIEGGSVAFYWTENEGMRNLKEILENDYGLDLQGWTLGYASDVSNDGRTIVGYAVNPFGQTEAYRVRLPETITCPAPTNIIIDDITTTTADVIWTENGDATQWEIEYGESGFVQGEGIIILDNDGMIGESLTGLEPQTVYDVYVRSICSDSSSDWAGAATFTTQELPCFPPSDILFGNITATTVDVSWTENGDATQWEIEYGLNGFTQGEGTVIVDNDGILGETISDLTPNTLYDVYVRSMCSGNESEWTGHLTFITGEDLGISENFTGKLYLYPNPTTGIINLQTKEKINSVLVYNAAGQKVEFKSLNQENTSIDISGLPGGIYFIELNLNNKTIKRYKVIRK